MYTSVCVIFNVVALIFSQEGKYVAAKMALEKKSVEVESLKHVLQEKNSKIDSLQQVIKKLETDIENLKRYVLLTIENLANFIHTFFH